MVKSICSSLQGHHLSIGSATVSPLGIDQNGFGEGEETNGVKKKYKWADHMDAEF